MNNMKKDASKMDYKQLAEFQNMTVARTKAIEIMELLVPTWEGEKWYNMEDKIENIINSK